MASVVNRQPVDELAKLEPCRGETEGLAKGAKAAKDQSAKSEFRIPKSEREPKSEIRNRFARSA
jgi:hypothetical protein